MNNWSNKIGTGLLIGISGPPMAFIIFCLFEFPGENIIDLLHGYASRHVLTHVISLSAIVNLLLFYGFISSYRDRSARGVLTATFVYLLVVFAIKMLG